MVDRVVDVAVVGAGPYGLSVAAHLQGAGVSCALLGKPMQFWAENVAPRTMLKSDGSASDLLDPEGRLPVRAYYAEQQQPFEVTRPIPIETFVAYGRAFQRRFVADARPCNVTDLAPGPDGFRLRLDDGSTLHAARVVLSIGLNAFAFVPELFRGVPPGLVTHSAAYGPVDHLAGQRVAVIGSGASAIDVAAVAQEAGAAVTLVVDRDRIPFNTPPQPGRRRLRQRIRRPDTGIGAGWNYWFYTYCADLFRLLPAATRRRVVRRSLGAAPGWFMRDRIEGRVEVITAHRPERAVAQAGQVRITLRGQTGQRDLVVDHVITATGYQVDMRQLPFLDPALLRAMRLHDGAPILSHSFQTSVPGLYVVGPAAAFCFGPVMRFVYGAGFAVPRLAGHLVRLSRHRERAPRPDMAAQLAAVR